MDPEYLRKMGGPPRIDYLVDRTSSTSAILESLKAHLPYSLPVYNSISSLDEKLPVFETLHSSSLAVPDLFVVVVDLGVQIRFYCSYEKLENEGKGSEAGLKEAEFMVRHSIAEYFANTEGQGSETGLIGAINAIWIPCLEKAERIEILYQSTYSVFLAPQPTSSSSRPELPDELTVSTAREEDIDEILSTSEVAHAPSVIRSRLPFSSAFYTKTAPRRLVAHCLTHHDGSLGTLHVDPGYRRKGFASKVIEHRIANDRRRSLSYVGLKNESSRALMKAIGWEEMKYRVAWIRIKKREKDEFDF